MQHASTFIHFTSPTVSTQYKTSISYYMNATYCFLTSLFLSIVPCHITDYENMLQPCFLLSLHGGVMGLGKQAKTLSKSQVRAMRGYLRDGRNGLRNETMFLLSVKAGLRAKEIAGLTWSMVLEADGTLSTDIRLTNKASKGKSGRVIPMHSDITGNLMQLLECIDEMQSSNCAIIRSERSEIMGSQTVINAFSSWYRNLGLEGCSSHSGRRTFITNTARLIPSCGGSLRDVQMMAGHASLQMTQTYIEGDSKSRSKVVALL